MDDDDCVIKLSPKAFKAFLEALNKPPQPNEALRRLMQNESILERIKGVPAQPATPESDVDPHNPNVR